MNKERVGILSIHYGVNFGSALQAIALSRYLKENYNFDKVDVINYIPERFRRITRLKNLTGRGGAQFIHGLVRMYRFEKTNNKYISYLSKNTSVSKPIYTMNAAKIMFGDYKYLIAGSDQIWNIYMADYSEAFFLPWKGTAKKISYAASLGAVNKIDDTNAENIKKWLKDFNMVSVREDSGANTLEKLTDKKIQVTLDPTLLLSTSDWNRITGVRMINKPYIFYYSWAYPDEKMNELVHRFAKEKNLEVYVINSSRWYKYRPEKFEFTLYNESGPIVFLNLMKYAEYVFVQSFHGTVFANIFQKRFFFLNEKESGEIDFRSRNLIELLHEEKQVVHSWDDVVRALTSNIEYSNDEFLDKLDKSYQFLDKAILEKENE